MDSTQALAAGDKLFAAVLVPAAAFCAADFFSLVALFWLRAFFGSHVACARGQCRLLDKFTTRTRETFEYDAGFLQCRLDGLRIGGNRCGAVVK